MTGIENHYKQNAHTSLSYNLGLVGAVVQIIVALLVIVGGYCIGYGNGYKIKG